MQLYVFNVIGEVIQDLKIVPKTPLKFLSSYNKRDCNDELFVSLQNFFKYF